MDGVIQRVNDTEVHLLNFMKDEHLRSVHSIFLIPTHEEEIKKIIKSLKSKTIII